jgi:hypothetical protein
MNKIIVLLVILVVLYSALLFGDRENWNFSVGDSPAEHSIIHNNVLYQTASANGIFMIDVDTGKRIHHWVDGINIHCAPIVIDKYIYAWNYIERISYLYKINEDTGEFIKVSGDPIDFEQLTSANVDGIDLIFIPKYGFVTAVKASDLSVYWTSAVYVSSATYHWDGGMVVGNYLYTRQVDDGDNKLVKIDIATGEIIKEVALDGRCHYATLLYDSDLDQIILTERGYLMVKAFDAQTLNLNWSYTMEEDAGDYIIVYGGCYHNGVYYITNTSVPSATSYMYAINSKTGDKIWKCISGYDNGVVFSNFVVTDKYLICPTHDYLDGNYKKMQIIDITNGLLYDTIKQTGNASCYSPVAWGGRIYFGMWDTHEVNCRVLGYGQAVDSYYKVDSYHTGYAGSALTEYKPKYSNILGLSIERCKK